MLFGVSEWQRERTSDDSDIWIIRIVIPQIQVIYSERVYRVECLNLILRLLEV